MVLLKINPTPAAVDEVISRSNRIMHGTPCFAGTRVPVKTLFDYLAAGDDLDRFLDHFPSVTREQAIELLARLGESIDASADNEISLA
jgi:uncharacterized protein (DUF433 family)